MTKKTLEELQETHSEMLATASDVGLEVPEELKGSITDAGAGETITRNLDALIREHQAKKSVATEGEKEQGTAATSESSTKKPQRPKRASAATTKAQDDPEPNTRETSIMSATAKKANGKSKPKKAAAKAKKAGGKRSLFATDAKITWLGKDNPARDGSGKHDRIENVRKHGGKTVATFLSRGKHGTLGWCVKNGLAKVG